jgi:hypothetical protein
MTNTVTASHIFPIFVREIISQATVVNRTGHRFVTVKLEGEKILPISHSRDFISELRKHRPTSVISV